MLQLGPQFPIENKGYENVSRNGDRICKKPRICEIAVPSPKMPVSTKNIMIGNFKTQLCEKFRLGNCSYGSTCTFAHGIGEVRKQLPNLQGPLVNEDGLARTWNGVYNLVDKSKRCRMFYSRKQCAYGDKCRFLHISPQKFNRNLCCRESSAIKIGATAFSGSHGSGFVNSKLWIKRKLCNKWEMTGRCPYGKICLFAHGQAEIGKPVDHIELVSGFVPTKTSKTLPFGKNVIRARYRQRMKGMKCTFKWEAVQKISGIYADWIEDMPLLRTN